MSNFKRDGITRQSKSIKKSGRLGPITRFEYINRDGDKVNPRTGKPILARIGNVRSTNGKPINLKSINARIANGNSFNSKPGNTRVQNGRPLNKLSESLTRTDEKKKKRYFPVKTTGALFSGLDPIPTNPKVDPPPRTCYNCWQHGHSRRSCPRPIVALFCINCGRRGEDLSSCPRCKRAHQQYLLALQENDLQGTTEQDQLLSFEGFESDENDSDEVLNELIYQDDKAREMLAREKQNENSELPVTYPISKKRNRRYNSRNEASPVYEQETREDFKSKQRRNSSRENTPSYVKKERDESVPNYVQQDGMGGYFIVGRRANGNSNYSRDMGYNETDRERNIPIDYERSGDIDVPLNDRRERARSVEPRSRSSVKDYSSYDHADNDREKEQDRSSIYHERNGRANSVIDPLEADIKHTDSNSALLPEDPDPVHDVLMLAKSISHLSSDTQDLIMRQVMAERKEKARQRVPHENNDIVW